MGSVKERIGPIAGIGCVAVAGLMAFTGRAPVAPTPKPAPKDGPSIGKPFTEKEVAEEKRYQCQVAGTVRKPGVIEFDPGERVHDLIDRAGGVLPGTDLSRWNLAKKVGDGDYLLFAKKAAPAPVAYGLPTARRRTPRRSGRPLPPPTALAPMPVPGNLPEVPVANLDRPAPAPSRTAKAEPRIVALNTCDAADLDTLPGIGPAMAARILAYRAERGAFASVDELQAVSGIGPKKLARLRPYLRL